MYMYVYVNIYTYIYVCVYVVANHQPSTFYNVSTDGIRKGVVFQRARAVTSCLNFIRAAAAFLLQRAMVLTFCCPGFWVS